MSWLVTRLAVGSGRAEVVRFLLVALGAVLATVLLLSAALVTAVQGGECRDGCTRGALYRTELLDQAGLRPGVVIGLVLMVVPVLVFLGMCARISAAQRDLRLSAIRLAGGTPGQVRLLAAGDTAAPAALGAAVGLVVFVVVKALLERQHLDTAAEFVRSTVIAGVDPRSVMAAPARVLPTDVPVPVVRSLLVLLLVPGLSAASAVLALRRVETTPLGVVRSSRPAPRAGAFPLLAVGLVLVVSAPLLGSAILLVGSVGAVLVMLALTASSGWLAARAGALVAGRTRRPAVLLAGRRLQADPRAQGRALSGVVLAVFVASAAAVLRTATLQQAGSEDDFYRNAYDLVDLALLVALIVAAAGLFVASCEAVLERRRTLASLVAAGVPTTVLRRAVLLQALLPAVPALILAAASGTVAAQLAATYGEGLTLPWQRLLGVLAVALAAVAASTVLSLPLLRRAARPAELRQT